MIKLKSLLNGSNITLYHATRVPSLIVKDGIKTSNAGVINKEGVKRVYASDKLSKAVNALQYEDDLKTQMGIFRKTKGDIFIVKFTIPSVEVERKSNGDFTINRDIKPEELESILTKDGKIFQQLK